MKAKILFALGVFGCGSIALAGGNAAYPENNVASFVVEKLDANSLPSPFRPKKEAHKTTLSEYGYILQQLGENDALLNLSSTDSLDFKILEVRSNGIFACVSRLTQGSGEPVQSVVQLKRKDAESPLKAFRSTREFSACPSSEKSERYSLPTMYPAD